VELIEMVAGLESLETCPAGLFVVGSGVDVAPIKSWLETTTSLAVTAPGEPETALARGAALAAANAPLFASSTAALAYAQDPGTGEVNLDAVAPGYFNVPDASAGAEPGQEELAYSAVPDDEADALTEIMNSDQGRSPDDGERRRRPVLLLGTAGAVVAISAVVAMEVALALGVRPGVALLPIPGHSLIFPQAPASPAPASGPQAVHISQPGPVAVPHPLNAPAPAAPAPAPIPAAPPAAAPVLVPPPLPAPVLAPAPALPAPDSPPPPLNLPAPQPPPSAPPSHVPVWQPPPTHVPVSHPPVHVPVPEPPVHVPEPLPPGHVPEPPPPVKLPSPDAPPAPGVPDVQAPPHPGVPAPEAPTAPSAPGHEVPPAPDTPPTHGGEGSPGGSLGDVGGHGSAGGAETGGGSVGGGTSGGSSAGGSTGGSSAGESGGGGGHH
jgi:hypothetical protein